MRTKILWLLFLCGPLSATAVLAETVYCSDAQGQKHIADDLMSLPEACRAQAKKRIPADSNRINYVPPLSPPANSSARFKQAVGAEEKNLAQKKRYAEDLSRRAENILRTYAEAVTARKEALRSQSYGRRDVIRQASEQMQQSQEEKKALLKELENARIYGQERQAIEDLLNKVESD